MEIKLCADGRGCKIKNICCCVGVDYKISNPNGCVVGCTNYEEKTLYPEKIIFEFTGRIDVPKHTEYVVDASGLFFMVNHDYEFSKFAIYKRVE